MAETEEHLAARRAAREDAVQAFNRLRTAVCAEAAAANRLVACSSTKNAAQATFDAAEQTVEDLEAEAQE